MNYSFLRCETWLILTMICLVWPSVSWRKIGLIEVPLKRKKPLVATWPHSLLIVGGNGLFPLSWRFGFMSTRSYILSSEGFLDWLLVQFCYMRIEIAIKYEDLNAFPPWFQFRRWCSALFWPRKRWRFPVRHCTGTSQTKVELMSSVASCAVVFTRHQVV